MMTPLLPLSLPHPLPQHGATCADDAKVDAAAPFRDLEHALPAERCLRRYPAEYTVAELLSELARRGVQVPMGVGGAS